MSPKSNKGKGPGKFRHFNHPSRDSNNYQNVHSRHTPRDPDLLINSRLILISQFQTVSRNLPADDPRTAKITLINIMLTEIMT